MTVAVIDTGVTGSPRVPAEPGGDFVDQAGNGMSDCDSHGTLTASIIAGRPAPTDGFIGVAPAARILSLRQTSEAFQPVGARSDPNDPNTTPTAGSLRSLARAVVHAANLGAQVINISEAACYKVTRPIDESEPGRGDQLRGQRQGRRHHRRRRQHRPGLQAESAARPGGTRRPPGLEAGADDRQPGVVLPLGADRRRRRARTGSPAPSRCHGPWVGAAAPAENLVALGYDGNPVNALQGQDGPIPISGTSFAAAYVSGLAACSNNASPT